MTSGTYVHVTAEVLTALPTVGANADVEKVRAILGVISAGSINLIPFTNQANATVYRLESQPGGEANAVRAHLEIQVEPDSHLVNALHGREKLTAAWIKDDSTVGHRHRARALRIGMPKSAAG